MELSGLVERLVRIARETDDPEAEVAAVIEPLLEERGGASGGRLAALAGGMAHDFNNLLVPVLGNVDLALSRLPEEHPARAPLEKVRSSARRAAELSGVLLASAGRVTVERVAADPGELVRQMADELQGLAPEGVVVRVWAPDTAAEVEIDVDRVRQCLRHLVRNAGRACAGFGSEVTVRVETSPGGPVRFVVSDDGRGMEASVRRRAFDPFFTTSADHRGLGLSLVRAVARAHGGEVTLDSAVGRGTTVGLVLPGEAPAVAGEATRPAETGARATVLVVDDEAAILEVVRSMLESQGFEVLAASDGLDALEVYRAHRDAIGVVLLDATMPRMSGAETLEALRVIDPDVRVILSSGYYSEVVRSAGEQGEVAGFLQKPYELSELIAAVHAALPPAGQERP